MGSCLPDFGLQGGSCSLAALQPWRRQGLEIQPKSGNTATLQHCNTAPLPVHNSPKEETVMKVKRLPRIDFSRYKRSPYLEVVYCAVRGHFVFPEGSRARTPCPLCQPDDLKGRSCCWDFTSGSWYCHSCRSGGDAVNMLREVLKLTAVEAAKWLEQRGGASDSGVLVG